MLILKDSPLLGYKVAPTVATNTFCPTATLGAPQTICLSSPVPIQLIQLREPMEIVQTQQQQLLMLRLRLPFLQVQKQFVQDKLLHLLLVGHQLILGIREVFQELLIQQVLHHPEQFQLLVPMELAPLS